jgi:hypothetical protein
MKQNGTLFKVLAGFIIFITISANAFTQEKPKWDLTLNTDIYSRYVWRGLLLGGSTPSIQPKVELKKGNFTLGAWGAFSMSGQSNQEVDLYASYTLNSLFTFTLTDYFFPNEAASYDYFNYDKDKTTHVFEAMVKYNGTEKLPFSFMIATNIYGNDARKTNGKITYSTYAELAYTTKIKKTGFNAFIGSAINTPGDDLPGFYGNTKTGIINLGCTATKSIEVTDKFSLPMNGSVIINPYDRKIFFVVGFTF